MTAPWRAAAVGAVVMTVVVTACTPYPDRSLPLDAGRGRSAVGPGDVNASPGCSSFEVSAAEESTITLEWDGRRRESLLAAPEIGIGEAAPLLVSLHPFTLPPRVWEQYSGLAAAAVARGYVVLSPLGSDPGPRWSVPEAWERRSPPTTSGSSTS